MKKIFPIIFILFILKNNISVASHAIGGELTYYCLGNNQYEITFTFYRDCIGIQPPSTLSIDITNSCGFPAQTIVLNPLPTSPVQISPVCPTAITTCNGGTTTGIQEWTYRGIITLPGECADWIFSHTEVARNAAITSISSPANESLFIYSTINNTNGICNNSPTFANVPVFFGCVGQPFCFNHGAYDSNGDSLSFQIITPRTGPDPGDTVSYFTGYSATHPLISFLPPVFNSSNGDFCIEPSQPDITAMAVQVNEYRNGLLIGQVERDIQLIVQQCNNNLPLLSGINGNPSFNEIVCVNQPNCFRIYSTDADVQNRTTITWDNSIPGATITTTGGNRDSATFCWTPTIADSSVTPYCFTASVTDDNCPILGININTYCFTVDHSPSCSPLPVEFLEEQSLNLNIFPQPATDHVFIDMGNNFQPGKECTLKIENILGEVIFRTQLIEKITIVYIPGAWSNGMNVVYVTDDKNSRVKRGKIIIGR